MWNGKEFKRTLGLEVGEREILPLTREMYPYRPYNLTEDDFNKLNKWNPTNQKIYDVVYKEFDNFLDLEPEYKALETITTMETYIQQKLLEIGYLFHIGDNDSGKTKAMDIHNYLDYRPLLSSSLPSADVYNYIGYEQEGTVTILEDEADTLRRDKDVEKLKIYRSGYKKGATCPRILDPSRSTRKQRFYKTFCSKIFAGLYIPSDRGFRQRCIEIPMVTGTPKKEEITEEDKKRMDKIKLGLLIWRMKHYFDPLPEVDTPLRGRLRELWKSKLQIAKGLEHERYIKYLSLNDARERARERSESLEAYITKALFKIGAVNEIELPFSLIWATLLEELGLITDDTDAGVDSINCPLLGYKLSKKAVGGRLRSVFNGKRGLRHNMGRVWKFKKNKLERLHKKFYINGLNGINDINEIN